MTCDPKFRRVLITDGRNATGLAMAQAMAKAQASVIFVGIADPWKPFPTETTLRTIPGVEIVSLDVTNTQSVGDVAAEIAHRVDILINTAEHPRPGGIMNRNGLTIAHEEMDIRYFGLVRLAQQFGPTMRARGADGTNAAAAFVNLLSVHALINWPQYGAFSAAEAACLSASQALRAELRGGGVKVLNMFAGPLDTEWFQSVPPPKLSPAALAAATMDALRSGIEDAYVGDIAQDIRARLTIQPKALERELAS
jgi:short-subunit dehydrogenase